MQTEVTLDTLSDLFQKAETYSSSSNHIFLLIHPSIEQYLEFIKLLYIYSNFQIPDENFIPLPEPDLLNYTYIKPDRNYHLNDDSIEVYTVMKTNYKEINNPLYLIDNLEQSASSIDVVIFEDCKSNALTVSINSCILEDITSIQKYIKSNVLTLLKNSLDPLLTYLNNQPWKSATFLFSDVSKWTYNTMTIPIVDFIQQYIRYLLCDCLTPCQLVYLPFELRYEDDSVLQLCSHLIKSNAMEVLVNDEISYNNIHIVSAADSPTRIQLLDNTFSWSEWKNLDL